MVTLLRDTKIRVKRLSKQRRSVSYRDTQTLVSGFNTRVFTEKLPKHLAARLNIGKFEFSKFDLPYPTAIQTV